MRVACLFLTGTYQSELPEVFLGIDQHGTGFCGEHDRVFWCHPASLIMAYALTLNHPEVRLLTLLVKKKLVSPV
jgi:hypothetical protein